MKIPLPALLVIVAVHGLWGANPIAVKFGLLAFPPLWSAFFRFTIGIVCVALWARLRGVSICPAAHEWPTLALLAALFFIQIATMNVGIDQTGGGLASILIATHPLFAAGFVHLLIPGDRMTPVKALGLGVAFAGTALTLLQQGADGGGALAELYNPGNWIVLFSALLLGGRLAMNARSLRRIEPLRIVLWQMLLSLPLFAAGGWIFEHVDRAQIGWQPLAGLVYQGVVIAGLGFVSMSYLMKNYPPSLVMGFAFVSPVTGVLLGVWLLGETLSWQTVVGMLTVGVGLYAIARRPGAAAG